MVKLGRPIACAALVCGLVLAPGSAQAATTLGETSTSFAFGDCMTATDPYTEVQVSTGAAPSYTVPAGGGVITSFSHQGGANETGQLKLKVFRPTADPTQYTVVGNALMNMGPNQLTTASAQIPVQAGDTLGYTRLVGAVMSCLFTTLNASDVVRDAPGADTADAGTTFFGGPFTNFRINIAAVLEPDADADGNGDESQDNDDDNDTVLDVADSCPTQAGVASNNGCPAPPVTSPPPTALTPPPVTKKKKCKKKKPRSAVAAKKCKRK